MRKLEMPSCKCGKTYGHDKLGDKCKVCKSKVDINKGRGAKF